MCVPFVTRPLSGVLASAMTAIVAVADDTDAEQLPVLSRCDPDGQPLMPYADVIRPLGLPEVLSVPRDSAIEVSAWYGLGRMDEPVSAFRVKVSQVQRR